MAKKQSYYELLKHPLWQKKRLEILELHNFECEECGDKEKELHVHHGYYEYGKKPWEYSDWSYYCLCNDCHKNRHEVTELLKKIICEIRSSETLIELAGYMAGKIEHNDDHRDRPFSKNPFFIEGLFNSMGILLSKDNVYSLMDSVEIIGSEKETDYSILNGLKRIR